MLIDRFIIGRRWIGSSVISSTVRYWCRRNIPAVNCLGKVTMKNVIKRAAVLLVVGVSIGSAANAASKNSADILQYIPADTPYVIASTKPLPTKLADKFEAKLDEILEAYQSVLRHVLAEELEKMAAEEGAEDNAEEEAERFRGLMDEVLGLMSLEGIRGAGIERDSAYALYGNGILPVLRMELSDEALFKAAIKRIEEKAGESLLVGSASGESYQYVPTEKVNVILAVFDDQLIITIVPTVYDERQVAAAIGVATPRKSLKKSKELRAIRKEYGYTDYMSGYVDFARIVGIFAGERSAADSDLFAALGETPPQLSDVCETEIQEMAGIAPRMVFGYSEINDKRIKSGMVVELREDLAKGLATIPAAVPGLGSDPGGLMSFGMGMDPMKIREFYEARLDALEADPFECEIFAELQAGVAKGREALNQPIPPIVYSFRGFFADVTDVQGMDMANNTPPTSIDASILVAMKNAEAMLMMAAMFDPQIAAMNLLPDGKPVKLELAQLATIAEEAFAALSSDALSVSIGAGSEKKAAEMLVSDSASPAPFMSISIDARRYYELIAEAMANAEPEESEQEMSQEYRDAMRDIMILSGSFYDRMKADVRFTNRGLEFNGAVTLGE